MSPTIRSELYIPLFHKVVPKCNPPAPRLLVVPVLWSRGIPSFNDREEKCQHEEWHDLKDGTGWITEYN